MAKRAALSFDALKNTKAAPAVGEGEAPKVAAAPVPEPAPKRARGRPPKRPADTRVYGMTLRIPGDLRRALRRLAEDETDARGSVVSIHDLILEATSAHLARKGVKVGGGE